MPAPLLPISALQHLLYCPRQCALIHVERQWDENRFTVEGDILHDRADSGRGETKAGVRVARRVALKSLELGLTGYADVVEFHAPRPEAKRFNPRTWRPYPVEYKRGRPKSGDFDRVQLCAQGMCLEEMLACSVAQGALYYGKNRRREVVDFDPPLRGATRRAAAELHELMASGLTPEPVGDERCRHCSLIDRCLPRTANKGRVAVWLSRMVREGP